MNKQAMGPATADMIRKSFPSIHLDSKQKTKMHYKNDGKVVQEQEVPGQISTKQSPDLKVQETTACQEQKQAALEALASTSQKEQKTAAELRRDIDRALLLHDLSKTAERIQDMPENQLGDDVSVLSSGKEMYDRWTKASEPAHISPEVMEQRRNRIAKQKILEMLKTHGPIGGTGEAGGAGNVGAGANNAEGLKTLLATYAPWTIGGAAAGAAGSLAYDEYQDKDPDYSRALKSGLVGAGIGTVGKMLS